MYSAERDALATSSDSEPMNQSVKATKKALSESTKVEGVEQTSGSPSAWYTPANPFPRALACRVQKGTTRAVLQQWEALEVLIML